MRWFYETGTTSQCDANLVRRRSVRDGFSGWGPYRTTCLLWCLDGPQMFDILLYDVTHGHFVVPDHLDRGHLSCGLRDGAQSSHRRAVTS